jgi:hypothetical protein
VVATNAQAKKPQCKKLTANAGSTAAAVPPATPSKVGDAGDLPLIGQLFRSSDSSRVKTELVILVTPAIVEDELGGSYGYGYRPSTREARQLMGSR